MDLVFYRVPPDCLFRIPAKGVARPSCWHWNPVQSDFISGNYEKKDNWIYPASAAITDLPTEFEFRMSLRRAFQRHSSWKFKHLVMWTYDQGISIPPHHLGMVLLHNVCPLLPYEVFVNSAHPLSDIIINIRPNESPWPAPV